MNKITTLHKTKFLTTLFIGGLVMGTTAMSETLEEKAARVEIEKNIAVSEQGKLEAELAILKAKLPETENEGLEGTVTIDDKAGFYAKIMSYKAIELSSDKFVATIEKKFSDKPVIITNKVDLGQEKALWSIIDIRLQEAIEAADELLNEDTETSKITLESPAALATLPAVLGTISDITKFFRTDREFKGITVTGTEFSLYATVAKSIQQISPSTKVIIPGYGFKSVGLSIQKTTALLDKKQALKDKLKELQTRAEMKLNGYDKDASLLKKKLEAENDELKKASLKEDIANNELHKGNAKSAWESTKKRFDDMIAYCNALALELLKKPDSGKSPLESVATIDLIDAHPDAMVLLVENTLQGAEIQITSSVWSQGRISYIGGATLSFILLSSEDDSVIASGVVPSTLKESFKARKGPDALSL